MTAGMLHETGASRVSVKRHARQIMLREIGGIGQQRLAAAHVAIVGLGGLGAPAALYLAAAGIGHLTLIDHDAVEISNLQRQILYTTDVCGVPKVQAAGDRLAALDPATRIVPVGQKLNSHNASDLLGGADLVLDGTDSFEVRFAVNAACVAAGIPLVSGAVGRWSGQVGVFVSGGAHFVGTAPVPCYRCYVPDVPPDAAHCAETGIIGALPGLVGSQMAMQAIKLVTGAGQPLLGRLWLHDGLDDTTRTVALPADPHCPACGSR